jgi:hypothetical protein
MGRLPGMNAPPAAEPASPATAPPGDSLRAAVILLIGLRLVLLMALPTDAVFEYGDLIYHYSLAAWSVPGHCPAGTGACWPLLDLWYEYPPLFPYLSVGLLQLLGGGALPAFHTYAYALSFVLLLADIGNLMLLHRLAGRLHGPATANWLAWVYALLPTPLILGWWTFEGLTTFWILLGLWAVLRRRDALGGVAIGLGVLTKFVPLLLLPIIWSARSVRRAVAVTALTLVVIAAGVAPFLWRSPALALASLGAQPAKSSYATVWAMLDGNLQSADGLPITGTFGPLLDRLEPTRAFDQLHNPARVPGWLSLGVAALIGGGLWLAARRRYPGPWDDHRLVVLLALTFAIFLMWSKGWSPQWQHWLVPLILLTRPNREGLLLVLTLAAVSFLEWPVLLSRGFAWGYWLTIPLRTVLFAAWGADLARRLLRPTPLAAPA